MTLALMPGLMATLETVALGCKRSDRPGVGTMIQIGVSILVNAIIATSAKRLHVTLSISGEVE
jgi:hypothetical protein